MSSAQAICQYGRGLPDIIGLLGIIGLMGIIGSLDIMGALDFVGVVSIVGVMVPPLLVHVIGTAINGSNIPVVRIAIRKRRMLHLASRDASIPSEVRDTSILGTRNGRSTAPAPENTPSISTCSNSRT